MSRALYSVCGARKPRIGATLRSLDYETIYRDHAEQYDELVSAEDYEGNLPRALDGIARVDGATVVDVGTGTGRIARLVLPRAATVIGVEPSPAMLAVAHARLAATGRTNFQLHRASASALPLSTGLADVAIAGWVFGHFRHWMESGWREAVGSALAEMERVVRPGGAVIVIETLGTGTRTAGPPNDALAEYYAWLEGPMRFSRTEIRTDYEFPEVTTAARVSRFFFGERILAAIETGHDGRARIPESTGIWSRVR